MAGAASAAFPIGLGVYIMNGFLKATFNRKKFSGLFINTALGNFAAYIAGSLVTLISTRHVVQRRAIQNLYGALPRKKIVVHTMPHWLEWLLALIVGFLVMEAVRYWFDHRLYARLMNVLRPKSAAAGSVSAFDEPAAIGDVPAEERRAAAEAQHTEGAPLAAAP